MHSRGRPAPGWSGTRAGPRCAAGRRRPRCGSSSHRSALVGHDRDRVALVGGDEDVVVVVEHDPVRAVQVRVLDETLSRHSVLAVNVVSQPVRERTPPAAVEVARARSRRARCRRRTASRRGRTRARWPRGAASRACWTPGAPVSVIVIVPGGSPRTSRPTPPGSASLAIGCTRKPPPARGRGRSATRGPAPCRRRRPRGRPARPRRRRWSPARPRRRPRPSAAPSRLGRSTMIWPLSAMYSRPSGPNASPAGLHGAGRLPDHAASADPEHRARRAATRPGAYSSPRRSAVSPSIPTPAGGLKTVVHVRVGPQRTRPVVVA